MQLRYLFVDMNSYFASVEQQLRPELRGRPVGVVPMLADTTCCLAASYEAKRFGVKTGTGVGDARRLCPGLVLVPARPEKYIELHHRIITAVESCLPVTAVLSVDEMVCRLRGPDQEEDTAVALGMQIKQAIREQVGESLRCSVGIAPNRMLAKLAGDVQKPDGLTVIHPADLPDRLYSLKLRDFPGIGPRMERRFHAAGLRTVEQLCDLTAAGMNRLWGSTVVGTAWYRLLRGEDVPAPPTHRRTLGHSHVLPPDCRHEAGARAVLMRLVHKAAGRLRQTGYWARRVDVSVTYLGGDHWSTSAKVPLCQDTLTLLQTAGGLWARRPPGWPLKVSVTFGDVVAWLNAAPSLLEDDRQRLALSAAMDQLNTRFGIHTVYFGAMHGQQTDRGAHIAFHTVPDLRLIDP
ncbi:MAG: type VI secretion protein ImpB [Planctomycetaceae bacterium]|nr:type VI secretion protein ImpB [Planctomycetaceae bacterium]